MTHRDTHNVLAAGLIQSSGTAWPVVVPIPAVLLIGITVIENIRELDEPVVGLILVLIVLIISLLLIVG